MSQAMRVDQLSGSEALQLVQRIKEERFPDADSILLAGSVAGGRASPTSDLDLVVIFEKVDRARRRSFVFDGVPVDAFCHDLETLAYFCWEVDRPCGVPALPLMLGQGIELPPESPLTAIARATGEMVLAAGPPRLGEQEIAERRAGVASLLDDLSAARSDAEQIAAGVALYGLLADSELRVAQAWSGRGKGLYLALERHDQTLARRLHAAFSGLFGRGDLGVVRELVHDFLDRTGGRAVQHVEIAPKDWRRKLDL